MSEIPKGWVASPLLDVVDLHDSRRIPLNATQRAQRRGEYPYYGANGQVDSIDDYIFDGEYVLLAEDGGYFDDSSRGVAYEVSGKFWVNNHAHILSARGGIPRRYLTHALNFLDWLPYVSGTTRLKLTQQGMQKVKIPLPPLPEQRRIVSKLDSLFDRTRRAREELSHIPRLIENYKRAILDAAFRGRLISLSSDPHTQKFSTLADVVSELKTGPFGSSLHKSDYKSDGTPVINPKHIIGGRICADSDVSIDARKSKELVEFQLREGDVILARRGVMGRCAVVTTQESGFICGTGSMIVRPSSTVITSEYLQLFLSSPSSVSALEEASVGTTMANLNQKALLGLRIFMPSLTYQKAIVREILSAWSWLDKVLEESAQATHLLDYLDEANLAKAFRGELVPQDPTDEPASVLLDRILTTNTELNANTRRRHRQSEAAT